MKVIILTSPALAPLWAGLHKSVMPEWPYHSCKVTKLENLGLTQISQLEWPRVSAAHFYSLIFVSLYFYIWCRKYRLNMSHRATTSTLIAKLRQVQISWNYPVSQQLISHLVSLLSICSYCPHFYFLGILSDWVWTLLWCLFIVHTVVFAFLHSSTICIPVFLSVCRIRKLHLYWKWKDEEHSVFTMRTHYASCVLIQSASNGGHNMHTCHYTHTHGHGIMNVTADAFIYSIRLLFSTD